MKLKEINLGDWEKTGRSEPYCMLFVYTPTDNILIKGMPDACNRYVDQHYPICVYRYTYWKNGVSRGTWRCGKGMRMDIHKVREDNHSRFGDIGDGRKVWEVTTYVPGSGRMIEGRTVRIRRLPHRWISLYDEAIIK